jgi:hypothetical protein
MTTRAVSECFRNFDALLACCDHDNRSAVSSCSGCCDPDQEAEADANGKPLFSENVHVVAAPVAPLVISTWSCLVIRQGAFIAAVPSVVYNKQGI